MANFITCWLKDPGDLPPGDGPPGGNGIVIPPDDDDDGGCPGFTTYCQCSPPANWQDVIFNETNGCTDCTVQIPKICDGTEKDCVVNPGTGCMVCKPGMAGPGSPCEQDKACCGHDPVDCKGYMCIGAGTADIPCTDCNPCDAGGGGFGGDCTDRELWINTDCKSDSNFGCFPWESQDMNGFEICNNCYKKKWECKSADSGPFGKGDCRWKPGPPGGDPTPGVPLTPPGKCWKCPDTMETGCCKKDCDRKDDGECPDDCYEKKKDCDDQCRYLCPECKIEDETCYDTLVTDCTEECDQTQEDCAAGCVDPYADMCWKCPDKVEPKGCCQKSVKKVNEKCPPGSFKRKKKCDQGCPKRCWNCAEYGQPCKKVTINCTQDCVGEGYYDSQTKCDIECKDDPPPPCTVECYTCIGSGDPGGVDDDGGGGFFDGGATYIIDDTGAGGIDGGGGIFTGGGSTKLTDSTGVGGTDESKGGGSEGQKCTAITVSCVDVNDKPDCYSLGYYDDDTCDGNCDAEEGAQSSYGSVNAFNRIYGAGGTGNPIYEKSSSNLVIKNNAQFIGVQRGDLRQDLFKSRVHVGIRASLDIIRGRIQYSDNPFTDLSDPNLEKSINDDIILKLNLARDATGKPLKRFFLSSIRNLIISNRLDSFNVVELIQLLDRIIRNQDTEDYIDTRSYAPISRLDTLYNEASAIQLATQKVWPLDPAQYDQIRVAERMRTWKTLATDLSKGFPVTTSTGATTIFYYSNYDTIVWEGNLRITMSNGDIQRITQSDGSIAEIPVHSSIKRAGILSTEVLQKLLYLLGDRYDINLKVTTDETLRVDERYGVTKDRKNIYLLALQPGTVNDLERINPFVARSTATYKYLDSAADRNSHVSIDGSGAAFPSLEVYLDINDPILSYIENDGTIEVTFKDFVLDLFDEEDQQNIALPVIARRAPQTIAIYTTDITANVITHNISKSTSYGVREIKLFMSPDTFGSDTWHPTFIKETLAYPDRGINQYVANNQGVQYSMATKSLSEHNLYRSGSQPVERIEWGERQVYKLARMLKADYQLPANKTVYWFEIYDRMDTPQKKFLHRECLNFDKFKSLLSMGKPAFSSIVNDKYPKVKEFRSVNWLGNTDFVIPFDKEDYKLSVKEGHVPIPPGELP